MRIFIAFVFLSVLYLSSVSAVERESIAIIYETVKKANNLKQSSTFSIKKLYSFTKEPVSKNSERIHRAVGNHQATIAINDINGAYAFAPALNQNLENFENAVIYSYQFIFNCLYPKHTFW